MTNKGSDDSLPLRKCHALYRRLASAYPHEFRMRYGEDLDRMGEDAIPEVWRRYSVAGLVRLLADIAIRLPATYFQVLAALAMLACYLPARRATKIDPMSALRAE